VRVPPGAVVATDLTAILDGRPATVEVTSNVPLTGAVTTVERRPAPDFTTVGATDAITAPAVVPLVPSTERGLLVTTTDRAETQVKVEMFDGDGGRLRSVRVDVKGRTTVASNLRRRSSVAYLVVVPRQGQAVHAVAYFRNDEGIAALPAVSGEWSLRPPAVQPAP
jgi:Family of unknown function (DUF5719)